MKKSFGGTAFILGLAAYTVAAIVAFDKGKFIVETKLMEMGKLDKREQVEFQVAQYAESTDAQIRKTVGEQYISLDNGYITQYDFLNFEELYQNGVLNGDVVQFILKGDAQGDIVTPKIVIKYGFRNVVDYYSKNEIVTTEPWYIKEIIITDNKTEGINKLDFIQDRIDSGDTDYTVQCKVIGRIGKLEEIVDGQERTVVSDNNKEEVKEADE